MTFSYDSLIATCILKSEHRSKNQQPKIYEGLTQTPDMTQTPTPDMTQTPTHWQKVEKNKLGLHWLF